MDIRQLKHLDALANTGSFTAAAKKLNMAQPALSQSIKRLELSLGVTLINRTSNKHDKHLALTAEGLPHGLRSIGSAPGVMLLAAIGL